MRQHATGDGLLVVLARRRGPERMDLQPRGPVELSASSRKCRRLGVRGFERLGNDRSAVVSTECGQSDQYIPDALDDHQFRAFDHSRFFNVDLFDLG